MSPHPPKRIAASLVSIILTGALLPATPALGVVLYRSATRNTTAPTGQFANSGWQLQGQFGIFLGTPIGSQYFITAAHEGGAASFSFNGTQYAIDSTWGSSGPGYSTEPGTDFRIWKIQGTFSSYAPLYNTAVDGVEDGKLMIVYGRGTQRGRAGIRANALAARDGSGSAMTMHELKGWQVGPLDSVQSWGTNYVTGTFDAGPGYGTVMYYTFDRNSPLNDESILTNGDSGGGVFLQTTTGWKLAGINVGTDGPYKLAPDFPTFNGPIFDQGGLYLYDGTGYPLVPDTAADVPSASYATDISANLGWINSTIGAAISNTPEPACSLVAAMAGISLLRRPRARNFRRNVL